MGGASDGPPVRRIDTSFCARPSPAISAVLRFSRRFDSLFRAVDPLPRLFLLWHYDYLCSFKKN
jgi:hypothetical protein